MIVTLLTDFGTTDPYAGVLKGVLLGRDPSLTLVDLTHGIAPGDIASAAYALLAAYPYFPPGTTHLVVVDPGVGTSRRPIAIAAGGQHFVGPDNGVFSYLLEREQDAHVVEVTADRLFLAPLSGTFHGRDLFAPVAAALAGGAALEALGRPLTDPVRLPPLSPEQAEDGALSGRILAIDRFGNCITSIPASAIPPEAERVDLEVAGLRIGGIHGTFAAGSGVDPFVIRGSSGFLEIVVNGGAAAERLGVRVGDPVILRRNE